MNRLIIIGNGFDLAHGLPTKYNDFIDDFWKGFSKNCNTEEYKKFVFTNESYNKYYLNYGEINSFSDFKNSIKECVKEHPEQDFNEQQLNFYTNIFASRQKIFGFRNNFFKLINLKSHENWIDIENEYYSLLKNCLNSNQSITELNREFEEVKQLFENYLNKNVIEKYIFEKESVKDFLEIFKKNTFYANNININNLFREISKKGENKLKEDYQALQVKRTGYKNPNYENLKIEIANTFLSFNYTSTMKSYLSFLNINDFFLNEIHGNLLDESNPINFGFGDEMDSHYKQIEEKNDNEYLKNIKSFQYLHTPNYKRLLDLIESNVFQVYIMGHSCGLSDRTLLNTIFEHENCCSIKIFYHQKEDGSDNYTEITQNISRHFNKKALMRERIVNKTLCQPLPQIQLSKKQ
ncbi:AbiH family protein [Flavobacterium sp. XGLA_31]|uniref:AbiH family protein n=1 Tax=Flavobacterium sp. XGLA_31 TaxID=3447666 RepID=UPI003F2C33B6